MLPPEPARPPRYRWIGRAGAGLVRLACAAVRLDGLLPDGRRIPPRAYPFRREIFALCERDALAFAPILSAARFTVLVAPGRDGDLASAVIEALGCRTVRGSARSGGARAARELMRVLRDGDEPAAIVVDGPLGPSGIARRGAVLLGAATGRPLRALGAAATRRFRFPRTWSGIWAPLPGARVLLACDEAFTVPPRPDRFEAVSLAEELTERLALVQRRARTALGLVAEVGA